VGLSRSSGTDLRDARATREAIGATRPDVVYHLAALSSVGRSWDDPAAVLADNADMALSVLEGIRHEAPRARVVLVSSGEVYGAPAEVPVRESAPLRPQNPYAVSKATVDLLGGLYADAHGLAVVIARAFNHAGPGQGDTFALSSFARQIAEGADVIRTGRLTTRRDFTDVRDVVRAYRMLAEDGVPGEAYNVCSGRSVAISELVGYLAEAAEREITHGEDPARVRAHEVADLYGSPEKLRAATGWEPGIPIARTAADALAWWAEHLRNARTPN
jgi:GDP-4-dehydro-6-deoxy-D-mannose reductase